jgi:hypothetical protein
MNHCSCCGKTFKHASAFRYHRSVCELLKLSKHEQEDLLEEDSDLPPASDLWRIVKTLASRQEKILQELEKMQNWVQRQKRKISIIDWLNENSTPSVSYDDWIDSFEIVADDIKLVFNHGFILGILEILKRQLSLNNEHELPIRAFEQKPNVLFVHKENGWRVYESDEFKRLISIIHRKITMHFKEWCEKNKKLAYNLNNETYQQNVIKIMGGNRPYDESVRKVNSKLYKYLKFNLKNIVQYEFSK